MVHRIVVSIFLGCWILLVSSRLPQLVQAQSAADLEGLSLGVAQQVQLSPPQPVPNGSIISFVRGSYTLSPEAYDKSMFGISATKPALEVSDEELSNDPGVTPILRSGQVQVRVNNQNGPIKAGDRITSSNQPGVGMKATKSGFALGMAEQDFVAASENDEGLIIVTLDVKFAFAEDTPGSERIASRLKDVVSLSTVSIAEDPMQSLKYLMAGITVIGSFLFAFFTFGRLARNGIEALGRNPMASHVIVLGMFFNIVICVAIMMTGLGTAYMLITW